MTRNIMPKGKVSCPSCGSGDMSFNPWLGQMWTCNNCGYHGPVELIGDAKLTEKEQKILSEIEGEKSPPRSDGSKRYVVMGLAVLIAFLMLGVWGLVGAALLFLIYQGFKLADSSGMKHL
jgi:hypothetical protein